MRVRLPKVRVKSRTSLVAVAVAAVLSAVPVVIALDARGQRLREQYLARARDHAEAAESEEGLARSTERRTDSIPVAQTVEALRVGTASTIPTASEAPIHRRLAEWHRLMERKYRRASRVPSPPSEPDPPPPD